MLDLFILGLMISVLIPVVNRIRKTILQGMQSRAYAACSVLLWLYIAEREALRNGFLCQMLCGSLFLSAALFASASNHFTLSLDIVFFFTLMLLIMFHLLKLVRNLSL
ncbi:MAG: hypothetical protein FNP40_09735 [Dehalobacter sp. 4CP]|uniref:hypothetical protein n=1 Tax=Dehalobacter sp. CP TaxID=2594474 RepID=UPI0013C835A5|nr:hypothetical protein [Dehalobacter sp.]NBJ15830.1 hypothetical protein [Dehalobacter sp. 4CP]